MRLVTSGTSNRSIPAPGAIVLSNTLPPRRRLSSLSAATFYRKSIDQHYTPTWVIEALLNVYSTPAGNLLEPAMGESALLPALYQHHRIKGSVYASDITHHPLFGDFINPCYYWRAIVLHHFGCIITNPPFSLAEKFVLRSLTMLDPHWGGDVLMLLRLGFLASKKRRQFWKKNPLTALFILSDRPSFRGEGEQTDKSEYAWFLWSTRDDWKSRVGRILMPGTADTEWRDIREPLSTMYWIGRDDAEAYRRHRQIA
jgi:hypothetical protein